MSINPTNYSEWTEAKAPDPCEVLSHPYPFTTYHEMSLGWFLQQWKEFLKNYEESKEAISGITADAETVPYTEEATVIVTGGEEGEPYHLHFKIPQGEPGQDGKGDVKSVNLVRPDTSGDITLSAINIPTPEYPSLVSALAAKANTADVTEALTAKVNTTDIIDVAHGGTGANNASDALTNLMPATNDTTVSGSGITCSFRKIGAIVLAFVYGGPTIATAKDVKIFDIPEAWRPGANCPALGYDGNTGTVYPLTFDHNGTFAVRTALPNGVYLRATLMYLTV